MKNTLPLVIAFLLLSINAFSQSLTPRYVTTTASSNGYYEHLPNDYNNGNGKYPLIIFFHGIGEAGNGSAAELPRLLANGTPRQISQNAFPSSFTVNGSTFKFIVIAPQFSTYPSVQDMDNVINYAVANYRVDINRIYLTGLSWGGGMVWSYLSGGTSYAERIAAAVPVCGSSEIASWGGGNVVASADVPVWATHNSGDNVVHVNTTIANVNSINNAPDPPSPRAKQTIFNVNGHDAWSQTYNLNFRENGYNVYEWMLTYHRNLAGPVPVDGLQFDAQKSGTGAILNWSTTAEVNNQGFIIQRSFNGTSFDSIGFTPSRSVNGGGASYQFTDVNPGVTAVYYRLKQIDNSGANFSYSPVRYVNMDLTSNTDDINIFPNPVTENKINIRFQNPPQEKLDVRLINSNGQVVLKKSFNNTQNSLHELHLPNNLIRGTYTLQLEYDGKKKSKRVQLLK